MRSTRWRCYFLEITQGKNSGFRFNTQAYSKILKILLEKMYVYVSSNLQKTDYLVQRFCFVAVQTTQPSVE
jgi:hypothetical protein